MTIEITPAELQIILDSTRDRVGKLYNLSELYREGGDVVSQKDCFAESRLVLALHDKLYKLQL